jgi:hypothetical protein
MGLLQLRIDLRSSDWRRWLMSRCVSAARWTWRAHPYHESCTHRCADGRLCRWLATVDGEVMCSSRAVVASATRDVLGARGEGATRALQVRRLESCARAACRPICGPW